MKCVDANIAVFRLAMALKRYDDACPDVGMGPSYSHFIDEAARQLELRPGDYDANGIQARMITEGRW